MVRNYKRKSQQLSWSVSDLQAALSAVRGNGQSIRNAAIQYGIPRATFQRHLKNSIQSPGKLGRFRPVFDEQFESELVEHCLDMQKRFYGLGLKDCRKLAFDLAVKNNLTHPFLLSEKMAGKD
jgi:hypothetical protein